MSKLKALGAALTGAVAAYLFDPRSGKGRRSRLIDQAAARARHLGRTARQRFDYQAGRVKGIAHELSSDRPGPLPDPVVRQKIMSEVVGPDDPDISDLEIDVRHGVVSILGENRSEGADARLADRIREVGGVVGVVSRVSEPELARPSDTP